MDERQRKRSPRAPSIALSDALQKALRLYDHERRQPISTDVVAHNLGYKSANNGAALAAIAALRSFGLLEKAEAGKLAVSRNVETYKLASSDEIKRELATKWLKSPPVFASLLEKYSSGLPSSAMIRSDLLESGFNPATAESVLAAFKESVDFTGIFQGVPTGSRKQESEGGEEPPRQVSVPAIDVEDHTERERLNRPTNDGTFDRIPVRLSGGRRAWIEIPTPFFAADKKRLKAQIDLLLANDEQDDLDG